MVQAQIWDVHKRAGMNANSRCRWWCWGACAVLWGGHAGGSGGDGGSPDQQAGSGPTPDVSVLSMHVWLGVCMQTYAFSVGSAGLPAVIDASGSLNRSHSFFLMQQLFPHLYSPDLLLSIARPFHRCCE